MQQHYHLLKSFIPQTHTVSSEITLKRLMKEVNVEMFCLM